MTKALRQWLKTDRHAARGHWTAYQRANGLEPPMPAPATAQNNALTSPDAAYTDDANKIKTGSDNA